MKSRRALRSRNTSGRTPRRSSPRWSRIKRTSLAITAAAAVLVLLTAMVVLRSPSPVGHWRGARGFDEFSAAYSDAMAEMMAVAEPDEILDLRTDFGFVRMYRFAGTGGDRNHDPLLLLPGRGSASPMWAGSLKHMLEFGDVYTIDLLGEPGMSVQERPIAGNADQAEWLHQALRQLDAQAFHFIGLSIGGWTATNYAVRHPEFVSTLTLLDPPFTFAPVSAEFIVRSIAVTMPGAPKAWRDSFNSWTAGGAQVEDLAIARMLELGQRHYSMKLPAPAQIEESDLQRLPMPVLAVLAEESVVHDAQDAAATAESTLPDGIVKLYAGASHSVGVEEPERVASDFRELLNLER